VLFFRYIKYTEYLKRRKEHKKKDESGFTKGNNLAMIKDRTNFMENHG